MPPSWWIIFRGSNAGERRKEVREVVEREHGRLREFWAKPDSSRYFGIVTDLDLTDSLRRELRVVKAEKLDEFPVKKITKAHEPRRR